MCVEGVGVVAAEWCRNRIHSVPGPLDILLKISGFRMSVFVSEREVVVLWFERDHAGLGHRPALLADRALRNRNSGPPELLTE